MVYVRKQYGELKSDERERKNNDLIDIEKVIKTPNTQLAHTIIRERKISNTKKTIIMRL